MSISEPEMLAIATAAARQALAERPAPSMVTLGQAAEILGVSRPTARKMLVGLANAVGRYPIVEVWRVSGKLGLGPTSGPKRRVGA